MAQNVKHNDPVRELIYKEARQLLLSGIRAAEFSRHFFGPQGRLKEFWHSKEDREKLVQTHLWKWLQSELADLRKKEARYFEKELKKT